MKQNSTPFDVAEYDKQIKRTLPFMFDVVTVVQVNHYFKKDERMNAIKNCYNALEENGVYFSVENFASDSEEGVEISL